MTAEKADAGLVAADVLTVCISGFQRFLKNLESPDMFS